LVDGVRHAGRKRHFRPSTGTARRFLQMNVGQNTLSRGINGNALISGAPLNWSRHFSRRGYKQNCRERDCPRSETVHHWRLLKQAKQVDDPEVTIRAVRQPSHAVGTRSDCPGNTLECEQRGIDIFNILSCRFPYLSWKLKDLAPSGRRDPLHKLVKAWGNIELDHRCHSHPPKNLLSTFDNRREALQMPKL